MSTNTSKLNPKSYSIVFCQLIKDENIAPPVAEFVFHPVRKWRFDFAWPECMLAVEIEGGIWTAGRHIRPVGMENDMIKYNAAAELGWRVLRYSRGMGITAAAITQIKTILTQKS